MKNVKYIMDKDGTVHPESNLWVWGLWLENPDNKRVASDKVGPYWVSTVFLGIDHQFGEGPPILFETMVFREDAPRGRDFDSERYHTYAEALEGHKKMVERWSKAPPDVEPYSLASSL